MILLIATLLFGEFKTPYETKAFVNLEGDFIIYARFYQGTLISVDSVISIPEYLDTGLRRRNQKLLLNVLKTQMIQQGSYANQGLFGTFEIPLPKGGFSDFMGESGKLDVGGYVKVTLGGAETFMSNIPGQPEPSLIPELKMEQEMAINLDGQVGDRMRVFIDHNSTRVDETQNKIRVTYKGKEDEIIQEIEGGDTQLSIPSTSYTGDIPSHQGLFGIKSTAKLGPVDFVAIASKEQTQTEEMVIEGASQADSSKTWSKEYAKRQFFWLGTFDKILEYKIFIDDGNPGNDPEGITKYAYVYLDINDDNIPDSVAAGEFAEGKFTLKYEGIDKDYRFLPVANIIELNAGLMNDIEALGVWYKKIDADGDTAVVGIIPDSGNMQLKLICARSQDTTFYSWNNYELRNYYQVVAPGAQLDTLRIYYDDPSGSIPLDQNGNGIPYLQILRVDSLPKDNVADDYSTHGYGFDQARGLLIFPDPMPFTSPSLPESDLEIYTNPYFSSGLGKYYMYIRTISVKQSFDLPPNTKRVTVYVNDVVMDSTKDYIVDYSEGKLEFRKPIPPTARVRIQVEYSPFFSLSQKSLVGMRASTKMLGDGILGSSFFYRTEAFQASPFDHIQLKDEPFNRMVLETDFALPQNLPFVTSAIDWLPLVETEAESKLNVNFEGALSFSNLNTRGSIYLDDLEATTITKPVQITRVSWAQSSLPVSEDTANFVLHRLVWYNPQGDDRLEASHIYTNPVDPNEIADVLKIVYRPDSLQSFAGLTQYITSENMDECENLELIVKADGGVMNIDLAQAISEDQLRRDSKGQLVGWGSMQDEDRHPQNWAWNELQEDTGLDSTFGDDGANVPGDDGNDDFNENDYNGGINGTEGNRVWDTENIDHDSYFNRQNEYYSYSIQLDSTKYEVNAGLQPGWKMFRIPIKDSTAWDSVYGTPDWHNIKYVRIWFTRFAQQETMLVYKLNVTGSRWKNYGVADGDTLIPVDSSEIFTLTPVNTETHSYYKPPYPLQTNPLTGKTINEGGLELKLENIKEGHVCVAHRQTEENEDYRVYDTLTFYFRVMHSNPRISLRVGADTVNNYYEYNTEYDNGTSIYNDWRVFAVAMKDFLDLKKRTSGIGTITEGDYTVVGNPSISANRYFEIRVENASFGSLTDTMWFNDVKLTSPRSEVGRIFRASSSINFADLSSFSFSFDESDGRFKRLSESKDISTQSAGRSYGANASFTLNKFLPNTWGYNIPLGLSYHKSIQEPRFSSFIANDVELEGADRLLERSTSISRGYTLHLSKSNSKNWLMKYTLDKLSLDHDRTQSMSASARNVDTLDVQNYRGSYTLDPKVSFKVFRQVLSVLPQNLSFSALYNDNAAKSFYRNSPDSLFERSYGYPQRRRTLSPSFSASYSPHSIVNSQYNFSQMRDSVSQHRRFGEEVGRNQSFNANASKSLFIFNPSLSVGSSYNEDHRFEMRQPVDYRNIANSARFQISSPVDVKKCVRFLTRLRDETKDTLQVPGSPLWLIKQIEVFVDKLRNPSVSFSRQRSSGYITNTRPDLRYQWGLADTIPTVDISPNSYSARNTGDNFGVSSGIDYNLVSLSASYSTQSTKAFGASGTENRTRSKTYPAADLRLSRIEQLPFLKKLAHSSSINLRYDQNYQLQYQYTPATDSLDLLSDSKTTSFSPLLGWQVSWVKGISTNASVNYGETQSHQYSDTYVNPSKSTTRGGSLSISYTFSAPKGIKIPLLQGIKFNSNLTTNVGINYNRNTSYAADQENPNVLDEKNPISDSESRGINILMTYNFSTSITGGANFDYSQNRELNTTNDSKRIGLSFYMNINF